MATAALFLGTRFLPALIAPVLVARVEQPPPRFALPVVYCGEAAAFEERSARRSAASASDSRCGGPPACS